MALRKPLASLANGGSVEMGFELQEIHRNVASQSGSSSSVHLKGEVATRPPPHQSQGCGKLCLSDSEGILKNSKCSVNTSCMDVITVIDRWVLTGQRGCPVSPGLAAGSGVNLYGHALASMPCSSHNFSSANILTATPPVSLGAERGQYYPETDTSVSLTVMTVMTSALSDGVLQT